MCRSILFRSVETDADPSSGQDVRSEFSGMSDSSSLQASVQASKLLMNQTSSQIPAENWRAGCRTHQSSLSRCCSFSGDDIDVPDLVQSAADDEENGQAKIPTAAKGKKGKKKKKGEDW